MKHEPLFHKEASILMHNYSDFDIKIFKTYFLHTNQGTWNMVFLGSTFVCTWNMVFGY